MKQTFKFETFAYGTTTDLSKWKTHGMYSAGLDIVAIPELSNVPTGARPNTIQLSQILGKQAVSSSTGAFTGLPKWIGFFPTATGNNATAYAYEPGAATSAGGTIYRYDTPTTSWVSAKTPSASNGGGGMQFFVSGLFYSQNGALGLISADGTYSNNRQAFAQSKSNPRPMKVFAGALMIGNDNLISKLDAANVFTSAALTLANNFVVKSLEVLINYLVISMDNGVTARIAFWNGSSAAPQEFYDLPESTAPILIQKGGEVFAIGRSIYLLHETSYEVVFPTTLYEPFNTTVIPYPGSAAIQKNQILFGLGQLGARGQNKDNFGGVWMLGRATGSFTTQIGQTVPYPLSLSLHYMVPSWTTDLVDVGGIYNDDSHFLVGFFDGNAGIATSAQYGVAGILTNGNKLNSADAYWETLPLDFEESFKKIFQTIKLNIIGGNASNSIGIYYRLDVDFTASSLPAWTLLATVGGTGNLSNNQAIPIRQFGTNIQFKFVFNNSGTTTQQLLGYTLIYESLDYFR